MKAHLGNPAQQMLDAIMMDINAFASDVSHNKRDDTTLAVVVRDAD